MKELQNEGQPPLPIQNSKDSKDSRNKSRSGEPAPVHKNYNVFPETHPSVFGKPVCDISRALSSIRNLPTTSNKKVFLTFALRMLAHDPKVKGRDVQELYQILHHNGMKATNSTDIVRQRDGKRY